MIVVPGGVGASKPWIGRGARCGAGRASSATVMAAPSSSRIRFASISDREEERTSSAEVIHAIGQETMNALRKIHASSQKFLAARAVDATAPDERTQPSIYATMASPTREASARAPALPIQSVPGRAPTRLRTAPAREPPVPLGAVKKRAKKRTRSDSPLPPNFHPSPSLRRENPVLPPIGAMLLGALLATGMLGGGWALLRLFCAP